MNQILCCNPIWAVKRINAGKLMGEIYSHAHKPGSSKYTKWIQKGGFPMHLTYGVVSDLKSCS